LKVGMKLPGIVTNVAAFGAFVDIGVHQDGLVHVSQLADKFVSHPSEVVKVQQQVMVTVVEVDLARKRIGLSMKQNPDFGSGNTDRKSPGQVRNRKSPSTKGPKPLGSNSFGGNW
ncbi:S1 RNA-binding domain-containing protein, partial [Arthrospira platensis SPKY1]|nr:S1 RNA-binding domain-containing protein [Arthrospira platensis SPKY1]